MYQPLAPDPLPPRPRVTNPLAPLLRLLLRVFNVALAALALLLVGAALWMGRDYRQGGDGGGGDEPTPSPSPSPDPEPAPAPEAAVVLAAAAAAHARQLLAPLADKAVASFPWFIYAVGGTGAYCFATALCGLAGVRRDRRLHLGAYIFLLALLVLAEAAATLLLLTDNAWRGRIPDDPSGRWRQAQEWLGANGRAARLAAVAALGVELAALGCACWLHAIYTAAYEAWLDDREEQSERAREVVNRQLTLTYGSGGGGRWRQKFGVEASAVEAATNAARQTAALQDDPI